MFNNLKFTISTILVLLAAALLGQAMINSQSFVVFAQAGAANDSALIGPGMFRTPTPPARVRRPTATKTRRPTVTRTKTVAPTRTRTKTAQPVRTKTATPTANPCDVTVVPTATQVCFDCSLPHFASVTCSSTATPTATYTRIATATANPCQVTVTPTPTEVCFDCSVPRPSLPVECPSTATPTVTITRTATATFTATPCETIITPTPTHCFDCSLPHSAAVACPSTPTPTLTSVPGAEFTGQPVSGVAPLTVHFTALNASVLSSCTWTFGDGTSQTLTPDGGGTFSVCPSVDHVYDTAGSFTVTLSVRKVTGASNSMTKVNYIVVTAPATITPTPIDGLPTGTPTPTEVCWDC